MKYLLFIFIFLPFITMGQSKKQALVDLQHLLLSEKEWVKVHVAEFLIWEGVHIDDVKQEFLKEERLYGDIAKYRIGVWRVLAQCASTAEERMQWEQKIRTVYENSLAEDRLHAIETLSKLKVNVIDHIDTTLHGSMRLYSLWNCALKNEENQEVVKNLLLKGLLRDTLTDLEVIVSSFVLRHLGPLTKEEYNIFYNWVRSNHFTPAIASNLWATLLILSPLNGEDSKQAEIKDVLIGFKDEEGGLNNIIMGLAQRAGNNDLATLARLFALCRDKNRPTYNSDIHASAAYMILKVF